MDFYSRLSKLGVGQKEIDTAIDKLTKRFGFHPPDHDVVWNILNERVLRTTNPNDLKRLYWEMAWVVAHEGKDPLPYLEAGDLTFFGHDELREVRNVYKAHHTDGAAKMLLSAVVSPAVLDELRKIASHRAREAKKKGDWKTVVERLEGYQRLAEAKKEDCIRFVNQAPPEHTKRDLALLSEAKERHKNW